MATVAEVDTVIVTETDTNIEILIMRQLIMTDKENSIIVIQEEAIAADQDRATMVHRVAIHIKIATGEDIIISSQQIGLADRIPLDTEDRTRDTKVTMEVTLVTEKTRN